MWNLLTKHFSDSIEIDIVQKKSGACRWAVWRARTNNLSLKNNILKIHDLFRHYLGQFMYKLENKVLPNNLYDMFPPKKSIHK